MKELNSQNKKTKLTKEQLLYIENDIDENLLFYRFLGFNGLNLSYTDTIQCAKKFQDTFPAYKSVQPEMIFFDYYRRLFFIPKINELKEKCRILGLKDITRVVDRNDYINNICPKFKEYIINQLKNSTTLDKLLCIKFGTLEEREELCDKIGYKLNGKDTVACILRAIRTACNYINDNPDKYGIRLKYVSADKSLCGKGNRVRTIGLKYKVEFLEGVSIEQDEPIKKHNYEVKYTITNRNVFGKYTLKIVGSNSFEASDETELTKSVSDYMNKKLDDLWVKGKRRLNYSYTFKCTDKNN